KDVAQENQNHVLGPPRHSVIEEQRHRQEIEDENVGAEDHIASRRCGVVHEGADVRARINEFQSLTARIGHVKMRKTFVEFNKWRFDATAKGGRDGTLAVFARSSRGSA